MWSRMKGMSPNLILATRGLSAVQLEQLYHQITWVLETTFLEVPRSGPYGRFFPIKEPEDLERSRAGLRELVSRNVLD